MLPGHTTLLSWASSLPSKQISQVSEALSLLRPQGRCSRWLSPHLQASTFFVLLFPAQPRAFCKATPSISVSFKSFLPRPPQDSHFTIQTPTHSPKAHFSSMLSPFTPTVFRAEKSSSHFLGSVQIHWLAKQASPSPGYLFSRK